MSKLKIKTSSVNA